MEIRREYDIECMIDCLNDSAEEAIEENTYFVRVPFSLVQDIMDVLIETRDREKKHKTLESALTFIEKEDGTQTNEMEYHNRAEGELSEFEKHHGCKKPDCYSIITGDYETCEKCKYNKTCVFRVKQKEETIKEMIQSCVINPAKILPAEEVDKLHERLPECIGRYNGTDCKCLNCYANVECNNLYIERTSSIEKRTPSCFKHFYDNCKQCDNDECIHREECKENSRNE